MHMHVVQSIYYDREACGVNGLSSGNDPPTTLANFNFSSLSVPILPRQNGRQSGFVCSAANGRCCRRNSINSSSIEDTFSGLTLPSLVVNTVSQNIMQQHTVQVPFSVRKHQKVRSVSATRDQLAVRETKVRKNHTCARQHDPHRRPSPHPLYLSFRPPRATS